MQQLEIVYSGIKGAILVGKSSGPPTEELPLFNFTEKKDPIHISFPFKVCKAVTLYCCCYCSQLICL